MPFVKRDEQGAVVAVSETCGVDCVEELPADDEALMAFLQAVGGQAATLAASDQDLIRVLEDVVELLIAKGIILFTELPPQAQEKILLRQRLRAGATGLPNLIGGD